MPKRPSPRRLPFRPLRLVEYPMHVLAATNEAPALGVAGQRDIGRLQQAYRYGIEVTVGARGAVSPRGTQRREPALDGILICDQLRPVNLVDQLKPIRIEDMLSSDLYLGRI